MSKHHIDVPESSNCCHVSIIDTKCDITVPPSWLIEPEVPGYDWMSMPTYAFYIKHQTNGRELLFDLGARKDYENHVPHIKALLESHVTAIRIDEDILDILAASGANASNVEAVILSHWHFDHSGALSKLPKGMKIVVGPGFKEAFLPGYPSKEDSPFHEADFEGREVVELSFKDGPKISDFGAYDYFGDGSLYIMNTPGHAIGHISALVRTTPDTFLFLGGDICHHTGDIRPSEYIPMPDPLPENAVLDSRISRPCPCSAFLSSHPDQTNGKSKPFFRPSSSKASFYADPPLSCKSVNSLIAFDADPNILTLIAHDPTSLEVFDFFPKTINDWHKKGQKEAAHWGFLSELPYNGKCVRDKRVDGLYHYGKKVRGTDLPS